MNNLWDNFFAFLKKADSKEIIRFAFVALSLTTVNFSSYIFYYGANTLILIDINAASKYFMGAIMLYAVTSSITLIAVKYIQNTILDNKSIFIIFLRKIKIIDLSTHESREKLYSLFGNKLYVHLVPTILIFSFLYVGLEKTLLILFALLFLSLIMFITYTTYYFSKFASNLESFIDEIAKKSDLSVEELNAMKESEAIDTKGSAGTPKMAALYFKVAFSMKSIKAKKFVEVNLPIFLLFISLAIGYARAVYIKDNSIVKINNDKEKYSLFLSTNSSIGLYDNQKEITFFIPWGKIDRIEFVTD